MDLKQIIHQRYATKKYNPNKKIPEEQIELLIELLQYSPTSINSQPYHFILTGTPTGKKRIASSMSSGNFIFNYDKVINASHSVVICSKTSIDRNYLTKTIKKAHLDGRVESLEKVEQMVNQYMGFIELHNSVEQNAQNWMAKQCYIALGNLLLGAAALGIDATPIEGFDSKALDIEFNLAEQGYMSLVVITLGYRADDDIYAKLPKSRLSKEDLFTFY
ncbi:MULTISPECIES: oxygen-insensitive NAD(P)H nitroreductase [Commensalibacter]|uniref:Dihydropteridine reductase n=2 Tax=Commensalibacter TaxID=1079922 RepID=W7E283_9PROT|nr:MULTISPECIES: oxygen-insensitive NAD(P)H nitroreductase [Commensalibacter]EUK19179.1 dihydropteridine reductase [Commensalibacter papalotli (ex Servin-Garciduenas et al. 2014)]CAI3930734.1 Nitroreductase (NfnB) (PDB:1F5V) [Commensalibacter papalotli (ex Botero et al. 2024)]CAI3947923.1 Nitroreductase (NfnB) (PDB:1F5V) [Commensalibacter papalotli (ex Botero et al. 2024)]